MTLFDNARLWGGRALPVGSTLMLGAGEFMCKHQVKEKVDASDDLECKRNRHEVLGSCKPHLGKRTRRGNVECKLEKAGAKD